MSRERPNEITGLRLQWQRKLIQPRHPPLFPSRLTPSLPPELLLVTWGLCFIAAKAETPATRGRDFTKPIKKGKEIVTKKRRSSSIRSEASDAEEQPYWSSTKRGRGDFSGGSIRVIPPVRADYRGGEDLSKPVFYKKYC